MKGDRFASDYERIRRGAGMARRELSEDDAAARAARVEAAHENFKQRMAEIGAADAARAAAAKVQHDQDSRRWNDRIIRQEYERAGVEPTRVDLDGRPLVSLSLLRANGWTIEEVDGKPTLMRPRAPPTARARRKTREEYAEESLKETF